MPEVIIQCIGFLALICSIFAYQLKNQKSMFALAAVADMIWSFHYYLLNSPVLAILLFIAPIRTYLAVFLIPQKRFLIVISIILINIIVCIMFTSSWSGYLPIISAFFHGAAVYFYQSFLLSRIFMTMGLIVWLAIGIAFGSYAEISASLLGISSVITGIYRHFPKQPK